MAKQLKVGPLAGALYEEAKKLVKVERVKVERDADTDGWVITLSGYVVSAPQARGEVDINVENVVRAVWKGMLNGVLL